MENINGTEDIQLTKVEEWVHKIDDYFRSDETALANVLEFISTGFGRQPEKYSKSINALLDWSVSVPAVVVSTPFVCIMGFAKKLEDGGSMFFIQERVLEYPDKTIPIIKIRCMKENADRGIGNINIAKGLLPEDDPRNTKFGSWMRRYNLEELPQLWNVLVQQLSLVGIRIQPSYVFDDLKNKLEGNHYEAWVEAYNSRKKGLTGLAQVLTSKQKEGRHTHADIFYARNASLGLDMYILWRTLLKLAHVRRKK